MRPRVIVTIAQEVGKRSLQGQVQNSASLCVHSTQLKMLSVSPTSPAINNIRVRTTEHLNGAFLSFSKS